MICQGASEETNQFLVDESRAWSGRRLHRAFLLRLEPVVQEQFSVHVPVRSVCTEPINGGRTLCPRLRLWCWRSAPQTRERLPLLVCGDISIAASKFLLDTSAHHYHNE